MSQSRPLHLEHIPEPEDVFAQIEHLPGAVWLDDGRPKSGWTIIAWNPEHVVTQGENWPQTGRELMGARQQPSELPFTTGCIGYVGYHAAHRMNPMPNHGKCPEPEVWLAQFNQSLCYRHADRQWFATGDASQQRYAADLVRSASALAPPPMALPAHSVCHTSESAYQAAIAEILRLLHEGDCYQINLSRAVHVSGKLDPWQCYRRLRRASNAGYGALLNLGQGLRVLSSSPELLLSVDGGLTCSIPIKGTRPRGNDPEHDAELLRELATSEKERAELTMIVDLVRNDLGRVSQPGSVVAGERRVDSHRYVHHASQTVTSTLAPELDTWDALNAVFPPGSVTGAPKLRACTRIHELETESRGIYCGAIGYASASGRAQWSVAIRTAVYHSNTIRFHVGGGIVEASDPADEWAETIHKARAMAEAFTGLQRA